MVTTEASRPTLLLVHGAWHGPWCWEKLESALVVDGWTTRTVELPSAVRPEAPTAEPLPGIHEDARAVLETLEDIEGPVVVVGHSYGGIPVTQAIADASNVSHAIYLAAYQLDVDESLFGFHGAPEPEEPKGVIPPLENSDKELYADVSEEETVRAVRQLVPQSARSFSERVTKAGWRTTPSTYIICEQDEALPPQAQERLAARANGIHRLKSSHSPFLSMPAELAALLANISLGEAG
ncbi:alpha/beta hydrolase [Streptomyces lunaelactis]|uniref:Alpha/beta hydrolase n=1 Tax=Streptomyces lunaelactis TaxID=1535768 RepID=A0A2R4TC34_9ACTN|nr:alpha/beta fold hydrolase [Streptomyces lunaelactis]AVZ76689.1 alpha/beta hydrolase [Streptomyces lunaelactis]NUK86415.1 alpha/beta hydrolase [Streptomyces lunaelactis]